MSEDWKSWRVVDVKMPTRLRTVLANFDPEMTLGVMSEMSVRDLHAMPNAGKAVVNMAVALLQAAYAGALDRTNRAKTLGELAKEASHD
jgi:hypothetical protein